MSSSVGSKHWTSNRILDGMGSIPVGGSDFFFVPSLDLYDHFHLVLLAKTERRTLKRIDEGQPGNRTPYSELYNVKKWISCLALS